MCCVRLFASSPFLLPDLSQAIDTPLMQAAVVGNADLVAVMLKMGGSRVNLNLATKVRRVA